MPSNSPLFSDEEIAQYNPGNQPLFDDAEIEQYNNGSVDNSQPLFSDEEIAQYQQPILDKGVTPAVVAKPEVVGGTSPLPATSGISGDSMINDAHLQSNIARDNYVNVSNQYGDNSQESQTALADYNAKRSIYDKQANIIDEGKRIQGKQDVLDTIASPFKSFGAGTASVMEGNAGLIRLATKPFDWVESGVAKLYGLDNYKSTASKIGDEAEQSMAYWREKANNLNEEVTTTKSVRNIKNAVDFMEWSANGVMSQFPVMADIAVTTMATGGGNLVAGATKNVPKTMGKKIAKILIGADKSTMIAGTKLELGSVYSDLIDMGRQDGDVNKYDNPTVAVIAALAAGRLESIGFNKITESMFGKGSPATRRMRQGILRKIINNPKVMTALTATGKVIQGMGTEGITEFFQTYVENAASDYVDETKKVLSTQFLKDHAEEALEAMAQGALVGGAMSSPAEISSQIEYDLKRKHRLPELVKLRKEMLGKRASRDKVKQDTLDSLFVGDSLDDMMLYNLNKDTLEADKKLVAAMQEQEKADAQRDLDRYDTLKNDGYSDMEAFDIINQENQEEKRQQAQATAEKIKDVAVKVYNNEQLSEEELVFSERHKQAIDKTINDAVEQQDFINTVNAEEQQGAGFENVDVSELIPEDNQAVVADIVAEQTDDTANVDKIDEINNSGTTAILEEKVVGDQERVAVNEEKKRTLADINNARQQEAQPEQLPQEVVEPIANEQQVPQAVEEQQDVAEPVVKQPKRKLPIKKKVEVVEPVVEDADVSEPVQEPVKEIAKPIEQPQVQETPKRKAPIKKRKNANKPNIVRETNEEGIPLDNKPILAGDTFKTSSGGVTIGYPRMVKTQVRKNKIKENQWLKDSVIDEAKRRNDKFNLAQAQAMDVKNMPQAVVDGGLLYLFGKPTKAVKSILAPLNKPTKQQTDESTPANANDKASDQSVQEPINQQKPVGSIEQTEAETRKAQQDNSFNLTARSIILSDDSARKKSSQMRTLAREHKISVKEAQEATESVLVDIGREISKEPISDEEKFTKLLALYERQPRFTARSSESIKQQAYSTPLPLAFALQVMTDTNNKTSVYEPTGGHGALVINADEKKVHINELNQRRLLSLKQKGFKEVTDNDATIFTPSTKVDRVLANPPFGGLGKPVVISKSRIKKLEHLISIKALDSMKDNGMAGFIIGAGLHSNKTGSSDKIFLNYLMNNYNVIGNFEVDGSLYKNQGAGFPVRVVIVDGKLKDSLGTQKLAPESVERIDSWDRVWEKVKEVQNEHRQNRQNMAHKVEESSARDGNNIKENTTNTKDTGIITDTYAEADTSNSTRSGNGTVTITEGRDNKESDGRRRLPAKRKDVNRRNEDVVGQDSTRTVNKTTGDSERQLSTSSRTAKNKDGFTGKDMDDRYGPRVSNNTKKRNITKYDTGSLAGITKPREATDRHNLYDANSEGASLNTIINKSLTLHTYKALKRLTDEVGNIDEFVAKELDYESVDEMYKGLAGEQIDGIALAIYNAKKGGALIIGDQTGVGKGRQAAGMMRYAKKKGIIPIFVTAKPKLFSDMFRDAKAIGETLTPFIMGSPVKSNIKDGNNKVIYKALSTAKQNKLMTEFIGGDTSVIDGYDSVFLTYSQLSNLTKTFEYSPQHNFLDSLVKQNKVSIILDESHEGAGHDSTTGFFLRGGETKKKNKGDSDYKTIEFDGLLNNDNLEGITYLSATYAKRPDTMALYFKTTLGASVDDTKKLVEIFEKGGVALQQAVANALADAGEYIRREQNFDGVSFASSSVVSDDKQKTELIGRLDAVTSVLRRIMDYSSKVEEVVAGLNEVKSTTNFKANMKSGGFSSKMHNYISQVLLALKTDGAIEEAIKQHKAGKKPLITLSNTMGSFINSYVDSHNLNIGDEIDIRFNDILLNALEKTMNVSESTATGGEREHYVMTPKELGLESEYEEVTSLIESFDSDGLHVSPIDYIKYKLQKEGITVGEITGRDYTLEYQEDGTAILGKRTASEIEDKNTPVNNFNAGLLNALILNQSGATGISLHAGVDFKDKSPRHMIILQPDLNIDTFTQMLGRILRTGMAGKASDMAGYTLLSAPITAEIRPQVILSSKMKSLNANTTSDTDTDSKIDITDFFNKYGDRIVSQLLVDNPMLQEVTGIKVEEKKDGSPVVVKNIARQFTGRIAVFPNKQQIMLFDKINELYNSLVEVLKESGKYDLEMDIQEKWDAKLLKSENLTDGTDESNMLTSSVVLNEYSINDPRKVITMDELVELLNRRWGSSDFSEMEKQIKKELLSILKDMEDREASYIGDEPILRDDSNEKEIKSYKQWEKRRDRVSSSKYMMKSKLGLLFMLSHYPIQFIDDEFNFAGIISDIKYSPVESGNPYRLSSVYVKFVTNIKMQNYTASLIDVINKGHKTTNTLEGFLVDANNDERVQRKILTGNIIQAIEYADKGIVTKFKTSDGDVVTGLVMPGSWSEESLKVDPRMELSSGEAVVNFLTAHRSGTVTGLKGENITIGYSNYEKKIVVRVPKVTKTGGFIHQNSGFTDIVGVMDQEGNKLVAYLEDDTAVDAINYIINKIKVKLKANGISNQGMNITPEHVAEANSIKLRTKGDINEKRKLPRKKNISNNAKRTLLTKADTARNSNSESITEESQVGKWNTHLDNAKQSIAQNAGQDAVSDLSIDEDFGSTKSFKAFRSTAQALGLEVVPIKDNSNFYGFNHGNNIFISNSEDSDVTFKHELFHAIERTFGKLTDAMERLVDLENKDVQDWIAQENNFREENNLPLLNEKAVRNEWSAMYYSGEVNTGMLDGADVVAETIDKAIEDSGSVANNPDIRFRTKSEQNVNNFIDNAQEAIDNKDIAYLFREPTVKRAKRSFTSIMLQKEAQKERAKRKLSDVRKTVAQRERDKANKRIDKLKQSHKDKINKLRQDMRDNLINIEQAISEYENIKKMMPQALRGKLPGLSSLAKAKRPATRQKRLAHIFDRSIEMIEQYDTLVAYNKVSDMLKPSNIKRLPKQTSDMGKYLDKVRVNYINLTAEEYENKLASLVNEKEGITNMDEYIDIITFGALKHRGSKAAKNALAELTKIYNGEKLASKMLYENDKERLGKLADKHRKVYSPKGKEDGLTTTEIQSQNKLLEWFRNVLNWDATMEGLLDKLERFTKGIRTYEGELTKKWTTERRIATKNEIIGVNSRLKLYQNKYAEFTGGKRGGGIISSRIAKLHARRHKDTGAYIDNKQAIQNKIDYLQDEIDTEIASLDGDQEAIAEFKNSKTTRKKYSDIEEWKRKKKKAPVNEQLPLSANEAYLLYLQAKNPETRLQMASHGYTDKTLEQIEKFIDRFPGVKRWADWQFENVYNNQDEFDAINKVFKDVYYMALPKVDLYVPTAFRVSPSRAAEQASTSLNQTRTGLGSMMSGRFIERVKHNREIKIQDGNKLLISYVKEMEHFKAFARLAKDMRTVFTNAGVVNAIETFTGKKMVADIRREINDMAAGHPTEAIVIPFLDKLRQNLSISKVTGISPMAKQAVSSVASAGFIGYRTYMKNLAYYSAHPKQALKVINAILNHPTVLERSRHGYTQNMNDADRGEHMGMVSDLQRLRGLLMMGTKAVDKMALVTAGIPAYKFFYDEAVSGKAGIEAKTNPEDYAIIQTINLSNRSQQSPLPMDRARRNKLGSFAKLFTMWRSSQSQYQRIVNDATRGLINGRNVKDNVRLIITFHFVLPTLFQIVSNLLTYGNPWGKDDDKDKGIPNSIIRAMLLGNFNSIPIAGDIITAFADAFFNGELYGSRETLPVYESKSAVTYLGVKLYKLMQGEDIDLTDDIEKASAKLLDMATGLPVDRARKNYIKLKYGEDGKTNNKRRIPIAHKSQFSTY